MTLLQFNDSNRVFDAETLVPQITLTPERTSFRTAVLTHINGFLRLFKYKSESYLRGIIVSGGGSVH